MILSTYTQLMTTNTPSNWFMNTIAFWTLVLLGSMCIGGFFMMRKFLKVLPKADGKSKLDWQNYWWRQAATYGRMKPRLFWINWLSLCLTLSRHCQTFHCCRDW